LLSETKAVVFSTLLLSNILITLTNRSFSESILRTFRYKNKLAPWIITISLVLLVLTQVVPAVRNVFGFSILHFTDIVLCIGVSFACVLWFEAYKTYFRNKKSVLNTNL
jgi:P-type Ca2+ transporter type 2C